MLEISVNNGLSVADLLVGNTVVRTPHIGNYNLGHMWSVMSPEKVFPKEIAQNVTPILMLNFDRNNGQKDLNFHPWKIIGKSMSKECYCQSKLAYAYENDIHIAQLRKVFPSAKMMPFTTYLHKWTRRTNERDSSGIMLQMLELVSRHRLDMWYRRSCVDGYIHKQTPQSWEQIEKEGILGINSTKGGWLLPNVLNVLLSIICEAKLTGGSIIYHLSGPDMYKYIGTMKEDLQNLYQRIIDNELLPSLPADLQFIIVPVSNLRFVVLREHKEALDRIIEIYERNKVICANRGKLFQEAQDSGDKDTLVRLSREARVAQNNYRQRLAPLVPLVSEMFFDISCANYLSQHDLDGEDDLYSHPWQMTTPVSEVDKLYKFLYNMYNK